MLLNHRHKLKNIRSFIEGMNIERCFYVHFLLVSERFSFDNSLVNCSALVDVQD
jgi:hypothetical protein